MTLLCHITNQAIKLTTNFEQWQKSNRKYISI